MSKNLIFTGLSGNPVGVDPQVIKCIYRSPERDCTIIRTLEKNILICEGLGQVRGIVKRWKKEQQLKLEL